jgi:hypothetical protein
LEHTELHERQDLKGTFFDNYKPHTHMCNDVEKLVQYKEEPLSEKIKEVDAKNAALQVLAARKTFGTQLGSIVFVFAVGVICGGCLKAMDS